MSICPFARNAASLALVLLGTASSAAGAQPIPTNTGNAAHDMMAGLSPAGRNSALDRVLHSFDQADCDVIDSTFVDYRRGRFATWRATCSDGRRFVLDLLDGSDWTVAVLSCNETVEQKARCER
jgi:hypothetical protein